MKVKLLLSVFVLLLVLAACDNKGGGDQAAEENTAALTEAEREAYRQKGQEIAQATFAALSSRLQAAMQEGGVANAVEYCNLVAYPLVDSLSEVHNAEIRRTSAKVRNPKDEPSMAELVVLNQYHAQVEAGENPQPLVTAVDEQTVAFYAPIKIQGLCLSCHGKVGETLQEADYALIKELYPEDEAVGYELGDLRGMWSIRFMGDR